MTKENIIPIENKKPVETVYELKNEHKIPSFEEFMKTYKTDENLENSYINEIEARDSINVPYRYGPGNEQSKKAGTSAGIGAGLIITTAICPPLGGALTTAYGATGLTMKVTGEMTNNKDLADVGEVFGGAATIGSVGGGLVASSAGHACSACKTPGGKEIWKIKK